MAKGPKLPRPSSTLPERNSLTALLNISGGRKQ
jgi:hypothetical protein